MRRWLGYDAVPGDWGRSVVTIGVFDGVHRGHQYTIGHAVERSADLDARSVVLTFDPHPAGVIRSGAHPTVLTDADTKAALIEALRVDALCVIPFTPTFASMPAETFVREVLVARMRAALVVVGASFRFGTRAAGDAEVLREFGKAFSFEVEEADLLGDDHAVYSSTHIRACIAAGDVERAHRALGRPHRLVGMVVSGDRRGRLLGFPTANLQTVRHAAIPEDGVYAGWVVRGAQRLPAAISVGANPTFGGQQRRVEAYILDFDADLYGERIAVDFCAKIRPMRTFDCREALIARIRDDVERTRALLSA